MPGKCEHGLTTKECLVCASPKYGERAKPTRTRRPAPLEQPLTFTRADPAELARFDPATKICVMNCGPHRDDPRSPAERKLLCGDCWPAVSEQA